MPGKVKRKTAFITGITGQDGSYLAELLLAKGYRVHGMIRRSSTPSTSRLDHLFERKKNLVLHHGDITDVGVIYKLLDIVRPDEIYNLAAQSHVGISFDLPVYTVNTVAVGTLQLLEAIRQLKLGTKFYQASSSEMFGSAPPPQNENSPFLPRSPYGAAKVLAHHLVQIYREAYGIFACSGILFNHESPRRGENFVTRKITLAIASILAGRQKKLFLGNLVAKRDWGFAKEYTEAMWLILQQKAPSDFVIATGEVHSVREFVEIAFGLVDLNWKKYVKIDQQYFRPAEVDVLIGDASKAKKILGWEPKVRFEELIKIMLYADLELFGLQGKLGS